jgi:hypothetical protein
MRQGPGALAGALGVALILALIPSPAWAADTSKVDAATRQVERGAQKMGQGEVGEGVEETAKGIGNTIVEGAKFTGEKFKEAGRAAETPAKAAGDKAGDGAGSFGQAVKNFFRTLFTN